MRASYTLVALVSALPLLSSATASAHFGLTVPPSTKPADKDGKGAPPCGPDTAQAGTPMAVQGGHDLDISFDEGVSHDGFYRIALSLRPLSEIYDLGKVPTPGKFFPVDNVVKDKDGNILPPDKSTGVQSASAEFAANPVFPVLADNMFPHTGAATRPWLGKVKLPNVNCDRCTLQVIQFMAKHGWNDGGGYFYHHCAEIKITADPALPIFDPAAPGGTGGSGGMGGSGGAAAGAGGSNGGNGGASAGTGGISAGGTPATGGTTASTTAGTATTAGTTTSGTAGTPGAAGTAANPGTGAPQDDSSCGIAKRSQGTASALAALGILFALGRRRRAR